MKRIMALVLMAAMLLCAQAAQAADWPEGLGPEQPYANVPKVDLNEQLGYVMFYPNRNMPAENVCQTLYIYVPREDVTIGEGSLELRTARGGVLQRVEMTDAERVTLRAMQEAELDALHWGSGMCFEVQLLSSLAFGQDYFVHMAQGCIMAEGGVESPAVNNAEQWSFTLTGDYGVGELAYRRSLANGRWEPSVATPQAGDEIRFELLLGGDAATAMLYSRDGSVAFPETFVEASGSVTGTVTGDAPSWGVLFLDAEQNEVDHLDF